MISRLTKFSEDVLQMQVRDMEPGSQKWIAKPSVTNQALGICIFDTVEALYEAMERNPDLQEWVLQRCV